MSSPLPAAHPKALTTRSITPSGPGPRGAAGWPRHGGPITSQCGHQGWEKMGREGTELGGHLHHKHSTPWKASGHSCGAPSCPAPARGHPWVQAGPQDTSRHRSSSRATAGLSRAGGAAEASEGLQDQAIKGLFALRISLGSLAHCAGGSGWGDARALAPAEDELYSHFHTWASRFPAGGLPPPPRRWGQPGASFGTRRCRAGTGDFSRPDLRVINATVAGTVSAGAAPSKHVAAGPTGVVLAVGPW